MKVEESCWKKFKENLPFIGGGAALGQGLAKQVGNVTECALLGFIQELGKEDQYQYMIYSCVKR